MYRLRLSVFIKLLSLSACVQHVREWKGIPPLLQTCSTMAQNCTKMHEAAPSLWKQSISGWKASSIGAPAGSTKDQSGREANIAATWLQATPHSGKRELNPKLNESAWKQEAFSLPVLTLLSLCWCQSHTTHQQLLSSVDWERRSPLRRHTRDSVSPGPSHHSRSSLTMSPWSAMAPRELGEGAVGSERA